MLSNCMLRPVPISTGSFRWAIDEEFGLAVSYDWSTGPYLSGGVLYWDGKKWGNPTSFKGDLKGYLDVSRGMAYLCTTEGYGSFEVKIGSEVY